MLVCRLSCGSAEVIYMQRLEELAIEAAHINIDEEVSFPASCLCLPGQSAVLHAQRLWHDCIDSYLLVLIYV